MSEWWDCVNTSWSKVDDVIVKKTEIRRTRYSQSNNNDWRKQRNETFGKRTLGSEDMIENLRGYVDNVH